MASHFVPHAASASMLGCTCTVLVARKEKIGLVCLHAELTLSVTL